MFKEYLLLLLIGHILGDFYTQTVKIAKRKNVRLKWVFIHCLIYFITIFMVSIPVMSIDILILDVATSILHALIDIAKYLYLSRKKKETTNISGMLIGKWLLSLLIIHKPANILIQNLIGAYKPKAKDIEFKADNNIGRIIGTAERTIMLMLIYLNQYSAIGLVLTAKSIARYDRISKDEKFAEYYLLGTLISTGIVIACSIIFY